MLYAKVGGNWVPITVGGTVTPPAEAGPRVGSPTDARFGNLAASKDLGFMSGVNGNNYIITQAGGYGLEIYELSGTTTYTSIANFKGAWARIGTGGGWGVGPHPAATSYMGLWRAGNETIESYVLLARSIETLLNVPAGGTIALRVGNSDKLTVVASKLQTNQAQFSALRTITSASWAESQVLAECESGASYNAHISIHQYYAPTIRVAQGSGERFLVASESGQTYCPIAASAFEVGSALATKHDVRTLHPQRERIVVHHDPFMDEVPDVDVMALRPVIFRRNGGPPNHVEHGMEPVPDPLDSSFGIQATRQRLGLIADEVQHVIPSAVAYDVDRQPTGIDYAQITVALLDHVQRLTDEVATLRYRIAELEGAP